MSAAHANTLLQDLAVVMVVAAAVTLLFRQLRQPVVLGYILAGAIIGPHTPPFQLIADRQSIETLAELGVVFLMFALGLEFNLGRLRKVGVTAFVGALTEVISMGWVGYLIGRWFGWKTMDCLFLAAMLSMSSTTIIIKVLNEMGRGKEKFAQLIFGILIVEDVLAMVMIALLSGIATTGTLAAGDVLWATGRLTIFLVVTLVLGLLTVPRLLGYAARFKSNEMLLMTVIGLCFSVSLLAVKFGYSVALGAFVIGAIIAEAREIHRITALVEPVRDMFSAVFFVTVGLMIDPHLIAQHWVPVAVITLAVLLCKIVADAVGVFIVGHDTRTSLRVGMGLAQIGEFSFIIATLGLSLKAMSEFLYPIAVSVSAITTLLTPYLIRSSDSVVAAFDRTAPAWLVNALNVYSQWVRRVQSTQGEHPSRRFVRRWSWQIALNVLLASGAFLAAVALAPRAERWWPNAPVMLGRANGLVWLAAGVIALPALIAAVRKLQALAMLLSEMAGGARATTTAVRRVVYHTVFLAGTVGIALWVLALSSTLLPRGPASAALLVVLALVAFLLWRYCIQIHARAQAALQETLAERPALEEPAAVTPLPSLLGAQLEAVLIPMGASVAGKLIRELELRTKTGASVVGIERSGHNIINPGPDDELLAGDRVLLLGQQSQLAAARDLLSSR
ncbi:MAG: Glutathione-regulated potassium-efflux system protein KefB [Verrucomicrobiae bacterium]|nr:Glutathione-regulated potassium-efflux system protein KefB [Verrucomicrobiae bacterium]